LEIKIILKVLPEKIGFCKNIKELILANNKIQSLPPSVGDMYSLENINLSHNNISELPIELGRFKHLRKLNISNNKITKIQCQFQKGNLEFIDMSKNQISYIGKET
jgi:Leucine-rich repeat (LRR) protein